MEIFRFPPFFPSVFCFNALIPVPHWKYLRHIHSYCIFSNPVITSVLIFLVFPKQKYLMQSVHFLLEKLFSLDFKSNITLWNVCSSLGCLWNNVSVNIEARALILNCVFLTKIISSEAIAENTLHMLMTSVYSWIFFSLYEFSVKPLCIRFEFSIQMKVF